VSFPPSLRLGVQIKYLSRTRLVPQRLIDSPVGHTILRPPTSSSPSSLRALIQTPDTLSDPIHPVGQRCSFAQTLSATAAPDFSRDFAFEKLRPLPDGSIRIAIRFQRIIQREDFSLLFVFPTRNFKLGTRNRPAASPLPAASCQH
jgi:hypothetical protein